MPSIAFDQANDSGLQLSPPGTSYGFDITVGSANNIVWIGFWAAVNDDIITGVTFAGNPMTLAGKVLHDATDRWVYLYYQLNPATGVQPFLISWTGSLDALHVGINLYTNTLAFDQAATNTASSATSFTTSVTTTIDHAWTIYITKNGSGSPSAGTGSTARITGDGFGFFDSGAEISPAALYSMTATQSAQDWGGVMASFAPSVGSITLTGVSATATAGSVGAPAVPSKFTLPNRGRLRPGLFQPGLAR